jgi:PhzF family phenazine biosynthesis protein
MNLSETAFLRPAEAGTWQLRWFTPTVEVALCGHATLASAHVLWETARLASDGEAAFQTQSGLLRARRRGDLIELDFPATPPVPTTAPEGLLQALGLDHGDVLLSRFDYFIVVDDETVVRGLQPDHARLAALPVRGVTVTAIGAGPHDVVSRFFAPGSGITEDPVTGSAHCALTPYWVPRLGRNPLSAYQASSRGGHLDVELAEDRVLLRGKAVTVLRGELLV